MQTLFVIQTRSNTDSIIGNIDTFLTIYDGQGNILEEDDDSGEGLNTLISINLNPGTIYVKAKEYYGQIGMCTLHAEIR